MAAAPLKRSFDDKDPKVKLERAVTQVICNHQFFATVLLRLRRVEGWIERLPDGGAAIGQGPCPCPPGVVWPQCPHSMATDGVHLWWNPRFVMSITGAETQGVLCHEVGHIVGLHHLRQGVRKTAPWNYACDQVVNNILEHAHLRLPVGCIPGVPDKCAEELYHERTQPQAGAQPQQNGKGKGQRKDEAPGATIGDFIEPTNADGSPLTSDQRQKLETATRIMVQTAINAAKTAGTLPAGMDRFLSDTMEPKVPWKEILSRFIDSNHRTDYSWIRPNRRYCGDGLLFPSLWTPGYGRVAFAPDASGSVDEQMLRDIGGELIGALDTYVERGQPTELDVLWFDTQVYHQVVSEPEDIKAQGGGGTAYAPIFEWLRTEAGTDTRAVIVVTDGICSDFGEPPNCPVLWVLTRPNSSFTPPFGELTCVMDE